ncbi:MAG: hypothetical protein D6718_10875 [Acidobacteria bacterium]|nr:MAG: hypothetical protein D6718_10875 [Acidobacteriota bacterium]
MATSIAALAASLPGLSDAPPMRTDASHGLRAVRADARDLASMLIHPGRARRRRWLWIAAGTGALYLARDGIRSFARDHASPGLTRFLTDVRTLGKGAVAPLGAAAAWAASLATHEDRERETATLLLESAALSQMLAGAGQLVLATERPERGEAIRFLRAGGHGVSGDAALAASLVWPLRCQYLLPRAGEGRAHRAIRRGTLGLLYAGAALTAYQRIDQDKHWAPDAFLGMMAGLGAGRALCEAHARRKVSHFTPRPPPARLRWRWEPLPGGIALRIDFGAGAAYGQVPMAWGRQAFAAGGRSVSSLRRP